MESRTMMLTREQLADALYLGELLTAVPEENRVHASNEAAAYIRGYASAMQNAANKADASAER